MFSRFSPSTRSILLAITLLTAGFFAGQFGTALETTVWSASETSRDSSHSSLQTAISVQEAFHAAAERVQPAVVTIFTTRQVNTRTFPFHGFGPEDDSSRDRDRRDSPDGSREMHGLGSGMIYRSDGYILTNHHVINDVDEIQVMLFNQKSVPATIVGTDPETDLAVIKIDRTDLPTVSWADSRDVKVGEWAIAIGSPFQLQNSVTFGNVSAVHRSVNTGQLRELNYEDFIQTDAPINQGNSGGPLVNIRGEVIGVNTLIMSAGRGNQGVGFAISANLANRTAKDLVRHGKARRPWLGVYIQKMTPEMSSHFDRRQGVLISEVVDGSPAEQGGLKQGDLITHVDNQAVQTPGDLQRQILRHETGESVRIRFVRAGNKQRVTVELQERKNTSSPAEERSRGSANSGEWPGMAFQRLTPQQAEQAGIRPPRPVVRVSSVRTGSVAAEAGLQSGDLIVEIDNRTLQNIPSLRRYLRSRKQQGAQSALLLIKREERYFYVALPLES